MKKIFILLYLNCLLGVVGFAQGSVVLDLSKGDGTKAFVLPRVATTASIVTPLNGMLVYDLSSNCIKVFDNGLWSNCLNPSASGAGVNCGSSFINGNYFQSISLNSSNTVNIVMTNNSASALTITPSVTDIVLSGAGAAGISVASVSPASVSPGVGGGASIITYTLSGTPTTLSSFTATFTKLGFSCAPTGNVCVNIAPIGVSNTTTPATFPGVIVAGSTINFTATGGTPNTTGMNWTMTSSPAGLFTSPAFGTGNTAQAVLIASAYGTVTVTFSVGNTCGLVVTGTQTSSTGDALRGALNAAGCGSCTIYDAAAANTWVNITAAEYAQIDNFMPVNIAAGTDNLMAQPPQSVRPINSTWAITGTDAPQLPANNYVVGFSVINSAGNSASGVYLKYSATYPTGFSMGGPTLNIPTSAANARIYYILKKPSAVISTSSANYVAIYTGSGNPFLCTLPYAGTTSYSEAGDAVNLTSSNSWAQQFQVKGTTTKKW